jgi:hypothetical protein
VSLRGLSLNFSGFEEVPGFFVAIEFAVAAAVFAMWREQNVSLSHGCCGGNDVPGIGGDDVGGDEIELIGGVGNSVGGYAAAVGVPAATLGALDLDAQEASAMLDGEVVRGSVSPGLGDAKAVLGGAGHKAQLGPFTPRFGVLNIRSLICHGKVLGR